MRQKIAALFVASLFAALLACETETPGGAPGEVVPAATGTATDAATPRGTDRADGAAQGGAGTTQDGGGAAQAGARPGVILFLGTSLTAGYGVGEDAAYPALIARRVEEAGLPYRVVNAGLSGETSAGGLRRIAWSLQEPVDVLVLELGANDGLRGLPVDQMRANLEAILDQTRAAYPDVRIVIAGMEAPPNLGPTYTRQFRETFSNIARAYDAALVPFLLEGVAGVDSLNQDDRIHPNAAGHRVIADNVWKTLREALD